jgi:hypothetical protein
LEYLVDVPRLPSSEAQAQFLIGKYALAPRLAHIASKVPSSVAFDTLATYDGLSVSVAAGVMGKSLNTDLSRPLTNGLTSTQTMRLGLPPTEGGFIATAAPVAQKSFISATVAFEKFAVSLGSTQPPLSSLPAALRCLLDRVGNRGDPSGYTFLEADTLKGMTALNKALADDYLLSHPPVPSEPLPLDIPSLDFLALHSTTVRPRRLGEAVWHERVRGILQTSPLLEQQSLRNARIPGSARFLEAIPMAAVFDIASEDFRSMMSRYLSVPDIPLPWRHSCGNAGTSILDASSFRHLYSCPFLGRAIASHDEAKFALAHAIHLCGHSSKLPSTEAELRHGGEAWNADISYFAGGTQWVIDMAIVNMDSDTSVNSGGRSRDVEAILLAEESRRRRTNQVTQGLLDERGNNFVFVPFVMASTGGFGPEARRFLKTIFSAAKLAGKFYLGVGERSLSRPVDTTWNTAVASRYWEMRLSLAVTLTDARFRRCVVENDLSSTQRIVGRQPHPDPNYSPFARGTANPRAGDATRREVLCRPIRPPVIAVPVC